MAFILSIDTTTEKGSIAIAADGKEIGYSENHHQQSHASWLQPAIEELLRQSGYDITSIHAVAVASGPGSYTGLRVGMASAKGLCYALNIPLIEENTLKLMASGILQEEKNFDLYCAMMDARRMEVFMAVFDKTLNEVVAPAAKILDENSFQDLLEDKSMVFFGSGSPKLKKILDHKNAFFSERLHSARELIPVAEKKFQEKAFADLAYSVPFYVKEFFDTRKK